MNTYNIQFSVDIYIYIYAFISKNNLYYKRSNFINFLNNV